MDSYVKNITIDVNAEDNYTMVKAKQGDKINRKIAITLKKDGENFTPSGVSQIWFRMEKPDSNIVIVKSTDSGNPISVNENVYTVDLTEQCLTVSGEAWCDIAFLDDSGNTLSSAAFVMKIIPMPNGDSARSSSAWTDLQNAIDNIETIVQEQLQPAIDDAERFAGILAFRVNNGYIQYTVDSETWINLMPSSSVGSPDSNTVPNRSEVSGETVTQALNWLKNNSGATSDDITNESTVTGQTVTDALDNLKTDKAPLDSPGFTGTPTSPTPENTDNSTKIATTAFVKALLSALSSGDIDDDSDVGGATVKASLSSLKSSLNTVEDDITNAETNIEKLKQNLATVEAGNTASKAYSVGEYVVVSGILYKVTSTIASGATFTIGTNVQATNVGEALKAKEYFKKSYGASIITSTDGIPHSGSDIRLAYNDNSVTFSARILLQNLTEGVRPQITLTSDDFVACPSFTGFGNPVMRGQQGNYSDECYCTHSKGARTIIIQQNNFVSSSITLLAGWGVYQIPGVSMV